MNGKAGSLIQAFVKGRMYMRFLILFTSFNEIDYNVEERFAIFLARLLTLYSIFFLFVRNTSQKILPVQISKFEEHC